MSRRFQVVTVLLRHAGGESDDFEAVISSEAYGLRASGEPVRFSLPADSIEPMLAELENKLDRLARLTDGDDDRLGPILAFQQRFGQKLFDAVLRGENLATFNRLLGQIDKTSKSGIRLRIAWEAKDSKVQPLVALPWELLHDESMGGFVSQKLRFPVSRYLQHRIPVGFTEASGPIKVLLVDSQPEADKLGKVDSLAEKHFIHGALAPLDDVEVIEEEPDLEAVRDRIRRDDVTILHFIGHGGFKEGKAHLTFVRPTGGPIRHLADDFAQELDGLDSLKLVVLSTCHGAALPRKGHQNVFDTMAPALMRAGIPAVVAMQYPISHAGATEFSRRFYRRIAAGDPVDVAAGEARRSMTKRRHPDIVRAEWPLPVVYMRIADGRIFKPKLSAASPSLVNGSSPDGRERRPYGTRSDERALTVGIRSFAVGHAEGMERRVDRFLGLEEHFEKRRIRPTAGWNRDVRPEILNFVQPLVPETRGVDLDVLAHTSIAFAVGWGLPAKAGLRLRIAQRIPDRGLEWFENRHGDVPSGELLNVEHIDLETGGSNVALACSITHRVIDDVVAFALRERPQIGRVVHVFPPGGPHNGPGQQAVHNGAHAFALANTLLRLAGERSIRERLEPLHGFFAMPNSLSVFFGQLSNGLGEIQLYEYPFREKKPAGVYWPSITLPPE